MKKKFLIILILFLNSCGFNPVFNSEQNKFAINKITIANNNQITNKIKNNLKRFVQNTNNANSYDVELSTKKNIIVTSKDKQGDPKTFEITIEAENADLSFKRGITTKITIAGSELKAHKIPPSILTLQDDGTVGVKAVNDENIVIFYPTTSVKDTIDGIWVSGLPDKVNLIVTGQEYVAVGESVSN